MVDALVERLHRTVEAEGGCLMVTTSRRTPDEVVARLRGRLQGKAHVVLNGPGDGGNLYPGMLAWADRIVCSPDSVNMVSEACATYVPVFIAGHDQVHGRVRGFMDELVTLGRARPLEAGLAPFKVEPMRETERIARELQARL